ncbi:MAG: acyltransferase family protein [Chloroflexales bacterium]
MPTLTTRRTDLDWLRVLSILMVFVFHASHFFDTMDWHVKNARQYAYLVAWVFLFGSWGMPLVFVIAAASTYYALGTRGALTFLKERALRLLIPVAVAAFTHAAFQVYLDRLSHGRFAGSFWAFYPHYFEGVYSSSSASGNFAYHGVHLWFLLVLFIFSALFLPLLTWLRGARGQRVYAALGDALAVPGVVYLLALPIISAMLLPEDGSLLLGRFAGWNLLGFTQFLLYGFVIATHAGTRQRIERGRWTAMTAGLLTAGGMAALLLRVIAAPDGIMFWLIDVLYALTGWLWVLAILGFGSRHLTRTTPWLRYANEAVMPFYVLHQTVLLAVGYVVVGWPIPDLLKFLVIAVISFGLIMLAYEYLIRRVNLLRFLFGMRPLARAAQAQAMRGAA